MDKISLTIFGKTHNFKVQPDTAEFKFNCRDDCTKCCENSTVFLTPYDLQRILQTRNISFQGFLDKYGLLFYHQDLHGMLSIKLRSNPACVFLKEGLCSIYEGRPLSCRMYPLGYYMTKNKPLTFWDEENCPGFGEGKLYTIGSYKSESKIQAYEPFFKTWDAVCSFFETHHFPKDNLDFVKLFYVLAYDIWSQDNKQVLIDNGIQPSQNVEERLEQSLSMLKKLML